MILIASAAYIEPALQAEFGQLPPSFLPLGNKRLFEHQIAFLKKEFQNEQIYLSLPENFIFSKRDQLKLDKLGIQPLKIPEGFRLAESILYALNIIGNYNDYLYLLHGDTLVKEISSDLDCISIFKTKDAYFWEIEDVDNEGEVIWCGFFSFAEIKTIIKCLTASRGEFVTAVRKYGKNREMKRVYAGKWFDLGHVNTYYKSRAHFNTQRDFNSLKIQDNLVVKTGEPSTKIQAEAKWFKSVPMIIKSYCPQVIEENTCQNISSYKMEYLCFPPLNELFVHARNPVYFWNKIFNHCTKYFSRSLQSARLSEQKDDYEFELESRSMLADKTWQRLGDYKKNNDIDLNEEIYFNGTLLPSINNIANECINYSLCTTPIKGVLHGDFCLSNILYDFRADRIKILDPRGLNSKGNFALLGDLRYDLAKLTHSIIGLYDFIIADAFDCHHYDSHIELKIHVDQRVMEIQKLFLSKSFLPNISIVDVMPITILLFLSMLPLHSDNSSRQKAFLGNALRLYQAFLKKDI
jgi:hypothetical protein